jgi:Mg-chelatase subunit ChlI
MGKPLPPERDPERSKASKPPVVVPNLEIRPATEVREWVLATAGARPMDRDPVDVRIIREVHDRTGNIPSSQEDVGGWPELAKNHRDLELPANPNSDDDGDGYTNLEEWLHGFSERVEP